MSKTTVVHPKIQVLVWVSKVLCPADQSKPTIFHPTCKCELNYWRVSHIIASQLVSLLSLDGRNLSRWCVWCFKVILMMIMMTIMAMMMMVMFYGFLAARSQRAVENREKRRKLVAKSSVVPQRPLWLGDRWERERDERAVLLIMSYVFYVFKAILVMIDMFCGSVPSLVMMIVFHGFEAILVMLFMFHGAWLFLWWQFRFMVSGESWCAIFCVCVSHKWRHIPVWWTGGRFTLLTSTPITSTGVGYSN